MEKIRKFHSDVKKNIRYKLTSKIMEKNLINWFNQASTMRLVENLLRDCKKASVNFLTPSPLFPNKLQNSLSNSQIMGSHFIPPISPNSASLQNYQIDKKNIVDGNGEEKKKLSESLTNSTLFTSMKLSSTIPKFFVPEGQATEDIIASEDNFINSIFGGKNDIDQKEFIKFTVDFYNFPQNYNKVLFQKIDKDKKGKVSYTQFHQFHTENFRGVSNVKKFFNFIKSPDKKEIYPADFKPFLRCLLDVNKSLEFLKEHPIYQEKYSDTVIHRIFYTNDTNDDGKITLREFKKSNLIEILTLVSDVDTDINTVRQYFSYEHFYVIYCIFFELDAARDPEKEAYITREAFSRYDGHALGEKAVDKIFEEVPRKFRSPEKGKMCFEDFLWYILSEEDKTSVTSIKYWFKILDLDGNGIVTPSEMEYFYQEQEKRLESYQNEVIKFNDVLCQMCDMIPPDKEYQWTLKNFLDHPESTSIAFNALFNLKKFVDNEQKDPFSRTEIDKMPDYTDWDKFAFNEYCKKMNEEEPSVDGDGPEIGTDDEN